VKLIVGLGNSGRKYQQSRHNLGFLVLEELLKKLMPMEKSVWQEKKKFNSLLAQSDEVLLVKPLTFMNASGLAVTRIANYYKIKPEDIWVVHDEIDLPLGKLRIRKGGGTAGHRGLESIIKTLGTDAFVRFRLGIGYPVKREKSKVGKEKVVERYVLSEFNFQEIPKVKQMMRKSVKAIQIALKEGLAVSMNRFN
jgi:PTH1 family peptidyl-tRNA hydrolase